MTIDVDGWRYAYQVAMEPSWRWCGCKSSVGAMTVIIGVG